MIFDAVFDALQGLVTFVAGLLPTWTDPTLYAAEAGNEAACPMSLACEVGGKLKLFGEWIDLPLLTTVGAALIGVLAVAGTVKLVLFVYEHIPFKAS